MKNINIKKIALLVFWLITIVGYEFVYRWMVFKSGFTNGIFQIIVFALPAVALVYIFTTLFSKKINKIITIIVMLFLLIVFFAQMVYFGVLNGVFSIYALSGTGEALGFGKLILSVFISNWYRFILLFIPPIFFFIFSKKVFDFSRNKIIFIGITVASFVLLTSFTFIFLALDKKDIYSSYNLYFNTRAPVLSAKKFGLLTTMSIDLSRTIFGFNEKAIEITIDNDKTNSHSEEVEYNNLDIDFGDLISSETNSTIISMHKYFESLEGTKKNDYTGMFEGKNVVFFLAESLDPIAIDPVLTPTLYKMANGGFNFTNYYSPKYPMSTADGEFRTEWSLISSRGDYNTLYAYRNIYNPFNFANSFSNYNVNIYHDWVGWYYFREAYFKAQGYDSFKTCGNGLDMYCNTYSHFHASDLYMINASVNDYINSDIPFFTYYITISGHLDYLKYDNEIVQKNWEMVQDLPYTERVKGFIAANIELDKALESLVDQLTAAGKLDDTVIVLTPDHYPYKLNADELNEVSDINRDDDFELNHSDLIIWNSAMTDTVTVTKVGSQPDVLPTLLNLMGIDYDSRMIVGQDLLSDSEGLVTFSNRSWITDSGKYNSVTEESFKTGGGTLNQEYIDSTNTKVANQFIISSKILENNYYKKVFKQDVE